MPESAAQEKINLIKRNGKKYPDNRAIVTNNRIFLEDARLPIERGDRLVRTLPGGRQEVYKVINPGFCPAISTFKEHYQTEVERETDALEESLGLETFAPVETTDARRLAGLSAKELFAELRKLIFEKVPQKEQGPVFLAIDDLEKHVGKPEFIQMYKKYIALCTDQIQALSILLPGLTKLL